MRDEVDLNEAGYCLYAGRLFNHDYLWFSSREISKNAATIPILHNYALSYAISGFSYGVYRGSAPRYLEDLNAMPVYATPAEGRGGIAVTRFTQTAINSRTLRTDDGPDGINTPNLGWRTVINPSWTAEHQDSGFAFYLFARQSFAPPGVIRLGKKGCPVRLNWDEIPVPVAIRKEGTMRPTHPVNPLDVQGTIISYQPVAIPPHWLMAAVEIAGDWFVVAGEHQILVPKRIVQACRSAG